MPTRDEPEGPRPALAAPQTYRPTPSNQLFPAWERALRLGWAVGLAVVAALIYRYWKPPAAKPLDPSEHFSPVYKLTSWPGLTLAPAISPNGNLVAFASDRGGGGALAIWTKPFDSGEPSRLTRGDFNDSDPDFSPDGRQIVFRSERNGGGVYILPTGGGAEPRLLASAGWRPRFSPDGKWIAYFTLTGDEESSASFGLGQIFIVSPGGGEPRRIRPDFPYARYPVWSPDGQRLLFSGTSKEGVKDWWVTPLDGGEAARTRAVEWLNKSVKIAGSPEQWRDDRIYFSGASESLTHIWELPMSSGMQAVGPPRRRTDGADQEQQSAAGPGGKLLFSALRFSADLWSLPVDADRAQPRGKLTPLSHDGLRVQLPSLSLDGASMAYISNKSGMRDVWVGSPDGKGARAVTSFRQIGYRPALSPDGKRLAYPAVVAGKCGVLLQDLASRRTAALEGCFSIWDWAPDGLGLLTFQPGQNTVVELRKLGGARQVALAHPTLGLYAARFSPDGRWIAFTAGVSNPQARLYVAPLRPAPPPESEWVLINPEPSAGEPAWSPDGNVLYFHSKLDGYHCIWAQKLGPGKRPAGPPIPIQHLHSSAFGLYFLKSAEFGMAVSRDQLILNLAKGEGAIWAATLEKR